MTKDTPIIFSRPMIRALLDGQKTQTRRIVSLRNCEFGSFSSGKMSKLFWEHADWNKAWADRGFPDPDGQYRNGYLHVPCHDNDDDAFACGLCDERGWSTTTHRLRPKIVSGDRLWVREAVAFIDNSEFGQDSYWQYRADTDGQCFAGDWPPEEKGNPERPRWKPAIHMPREASRLTLLVDAVKVERVQEISEQDAIAEGCSGVLGPNPDFPDEWDPSPQEEFAALWRSINGAESWDENPFGVAIIFRVIKANIDAPEARVAA